MGEINAFYLCHFTGYRRSTGSAHASKVFTELENINWLEGEDLFQIFELPDTERFMKQFCSKFGSTVPDVNKMAQNWLFKQLV